MNIYVGVNQAYDWLVKQSFIFWGYIPLLPKYSIVLVIL